MIGVIGRCLVANVHGVDSSIRLSMPVGRFARSITTARSRSVAHSNEDHNKPIALDSPSTTTTSTTSSSDIPFQHRSATKVISTGTIPIEHEHKRHLLRPVHLLRDRTFDDDDDDDDGAASGSWQESLNRQRETDARQIESRLMDSQAIGWHLPHNQSHPASGGMGHVAAEAGSIDVARFSHFLHSALTRTRIGYHHHHHQSAASSGIHHPVNGQNNNHSGGHSPLSPLSTSANLSSSYSRFLGVSIDKLAACLLTTSSAPKLLPQNLIALHPRPYIFDTPEEKSHRRQFEMKVSRFV